MTFVGKFCYISSTLLLVLAKISGQVMMTTAIYSWILSSDLNKTAEFFLLVIPVASIDYIHNFKNATLNFFWAKAFDSGYKLETKFIPTTAVNHLQQGKSKLLFWARHMNLFWFFICPLFCFMDLSRARSTNHPDVYNFKNTIKSRYNFRYRFIFALGKTIIKKLKYSS